MPQKNDDNPLLVLAEAAIDISDLARGVCGEVEVEGVNEIHAAQILFLQHGWKRSKRHEGWSKLEHRTYRCGTKKTGYRWLNITIGHLFGTFATFEVVPWCSRG